MACYFSHKITTTCYTQLKCNITILHDHSGRPLHHPGHPGHLVPRLGGPPPVLSLVLQVAPVVPAAGGVGPKIVLNLPGERVYRQGTVSTTKR